MSNLRAFAASRLASLRNKLEQEQRSLHELIRQGVPAWLGREFSDSPLCDLLERQRSDLVMAYQAALEEMRQLHNASVKDIQGISGLDPEVVIKVYEALVDLTKQARILSTRLQSYEDRREDLDAWHQVSHTASQLNAMVETAEQVYGDESFASEMQQLWGNLRKRLESQPLATLGMHKDAARLITGQNQKVSRWLESRREDFERQCKAYREALGEVGIRADLNIPFDQEHPTESYSALNQAVVRLVTDFWRELLQSLRDLRQIVRYGIRVQELPLSDTEDRARSAWQQVSDMEKHLAPEILGDFKCFKNDALAQLVELSAEAKALTAEVQTAIQPRSPEGSEIRLMHLLTEASDRQSVDLRGLIMWLLDEGEAEVDLEALMRDLQSLFQKNQIAIRISVSHSDN
jgi:hypothetical protein